MELINGGYSIEEMLRLSELIGCYADGGFFSLINEVEMQNLERNASRFFT